MTSLDSK